MKHGPNRAILFDLDDTLYPRRRFVLSGFRAVARRVQQSTGVEAGRVFDLLSRLSRGPGAGRELQLCLEKLRLPGLAVHELVDIIRTHRPAIRLPLESRRTLERARVGWRLGVVTNGLPAVQAGKVEALGLASCVDTVVFACEHGSGRGKPDRAPFLEALRRLDVPPSRAVFVGDDDAADMFGAAAAGLGGIFFGGHRAASCAPPRYADAVVTRLSAVPRVAAGLLRRQAGRHVA